MPRKRVLKTDRVNIDENNITQAIISSFNGTYSTRRAAIVFGIKRSTLQSRIKKILDRTTIDDYLRKHLQRQDDSGNESSAEDSPKYSSKYTNSVRQVFTTEEEDELEKYIKKCSDINYGLTYRDIEKLAYEYSQALPNCNTPAEWQQQKQAKSGWRRGFMARHKSLSLRKPESTSLSRSTAFNKHTVGRFFDNYKSLLDRYNFPPERIFNLDETGVTTVMKPVKIVTTLGKKQVSQVASAERGELVTFVGIINAIGQSLPPVYVIPRIRNLEDYMADAPASSLVLGNKSGWMTAELFPKVLKHIVKHTSCRVDSPILLIVDNHESHVNISSVRFCKANGIILLSIPPHTSHKLQPLDVGIYGPFKTYCSTAFNDWLTSHPGKTLSIKNIPELTKLAYLRAFTTSNIVNSFRKPGIWPLNRLAFGDEDFASSYVTDRLPANNVTLQNLNQVANTQGTIEQQNLLTVEAGVEKDAETDAGKGAEAEIEKEGEADAEKEAEADTEKQVEADAERVSPLENEFTTPICSGIKMNRPKKLKITPECIRPYPKAGERKMKGKRLGGSKIYTDTPEKNLLEEIEKEREMKKQKSAKEKNTTRNLFGKTVKNKPPTKRLKMSEDLEVSSEGSGDISLHDDSGEDLSDEFENLLEIKNKSELNKNDFVLVRFKVKNAHIHFIGQILGGSDTLIKIKFLRRNGRSNTFYFPTIDDISEVINDDIIAKLIPPAQTGTARTSSFFRFYYNFGTLVVQ